MDELTKLRKRVKNLLKKPQPEQRTPEWFKARQCRVTASEAASCLYKSEKVCKPYVDAFKLVNFKYKDTEPLNPYETRQDYIIKKCSAVYGEAVFKDTPYTLWGKKYEEVAQRLYCQVKGVRVLEFGLLPHSRLQWMAASPDGITDDGVMLEIKCPKSRKIDETAPPLYYWIQMMIQLETADLEECDYLECEISEVNEDEYKNIQLSEKQAFGIIMQDTEHSEKYIYPPLELVTNDDYLEWKNTFSDKYIPLYYYITKYNIMRIKRDREWFNAVKDDIKSTWKIIIRLQSDRDAFDKFKQSIDLIKNKSFNDLYDQTYCLINDNDSTFVHFAQSSQSSEIHQEIQESTAPSAHDICLID